MLSAAGWLSPMAGRPIPAKGICLVPVRPADANDEAPRSSSSVQGNHEALFAEIRQGTSGWQQHAFTEFHGLVRGLIVKCFGPAFEAEELVDDVFLRFFESAKRIRSADRVQSYIVSITMNCVRSELRQRKRAALTSAGADGPAIQDRPSRDDPKAKAALIQLGAVINELDPEERAVFVLRTVQGMPLVEVAEVLGISLSTAHRRVRRATEVVMKRVQRNALLCDYVLERGGKLR